MSIRTVGVVGAGTIGRGVAQSFAEYGFEVVLVDISQAQLDSAVAQIGRDLLVQPMLLGKPLKEDPKTVLARISTGTELTALAAADFVIENVTENWDIKRAVYEQIDAICRPGVIFGVNTSAVPITRVGSITGRPAEILGLHFMNPVPMMDTVEVVSGHFTSEETLNTALGLLSEMGKEGIVVQDAPGFITNRVLMVTINEAIFCVQDQIASAEDVDKMFRGCFGHKMGPLETGDLIGLDTILNSITVMYESYKDSKYRPAPLLQKMVDARLLGRKTGQGFYTY
ncbi:3-hydroxybutyryl-CoA dehydrogenase [Streptomyces sp. CJ_13]|uniref:3-hydroxyacyl-CoA dehydrogenase family protein n=1 Tax=Streptomyces TaxID=1883 RepID=UPI000F3A9B3C|nr:MULTISPECIES: 3-hydroxyacyl-CoA dehydrogenase NAD-binding domain-containing protein [unclassified Streptomyces]AYV31130.1 putative 3-hydroxybutyryl-CoA dehydrogenase [Streptomyces sp. ADI95-16]MBT1186889.1 3-hydroxybutyryl-CoA dehydrogenase [Streptomyces sp. CJ_13]